MTPNRALALCLAQTSLLLFAAILPARAAELADGAWQGTWFPGNSCRETRERRITATARDGKLQGSIENSSGQAGHLEATVDEDGSFRGSVLNLQRYTVTMYGRAGAGRITGSWTVREDCGRGKFELTLVEAAQGQAGASSDAKAPQALGGKEERAALVQSFYDQGLITETEYKQTLARIGAPPPASSAAQTEGGARLQTLQRLFQQRLITEDEYKRKAAEIEAAAD